MKNGEFQADTGHQPGCLNPRHTFDSFVIGAANRLAHAAARRVAETPGSVYNPLFIHGQSGLGKSHLLHAVGHAVTEAPGVRAHCTSMETLVENYTRWIGSGQGSSLSHRYGGCDVLLIDDAHALAGQTELQEVLAEFFVRMVAEQKQVVVVSGEGPGSTPVFEDWMYRRFDHGLAVAVQPPDLQLRRAIVRQFAATDRVQLPADVLEVLALHLERDLRQLEGALIRVAAYVSLEGAPATQDLAWRVLGDCLGPEVSKRRPLRVVE